MKIVKSFNQWQSLNENENLDLKTDKTEEIKSESKDRKRNRRKYRKDNWISDSGAEYVLTKKREKDPDKDTFVLKGKNKKSPVWDENGKIVDDVKDFLTHDLMGGSNEGKYDEDSIQIEKYKEGNKDRVKFSIALNKEQEDSKEDSKEEESEKGGKYEKIELPKNREGETRIEVGEESEALLKIKELIRAAYSKKVTLGNEFGMGWLDSKKLEETDINGWVIPFRLAFGMKSANFISQGLVDEMVDQANKWESGSSTEEVASNESGLFKFSDFVMITEDFDIALAQKEINKAAEATPAAKKEEPAETSSNTDSSGSGSGSTGGESASGDGDGLLTDEQAIKYRTWANSDEVLKKAYGKPSQFDLDETGTNNSYVKRSYGQAKADMDKQTGPMADEKYRTALSAITGGGTAAATEGEGYLMGYIQYKGKVSQQYVPGDIVAGTKVYETDNSRIAVHFANPRPKMGAVKAGQIVTFKDGWDAADFGYVVDDVWKDSSGNLGAIYIFSPSYVKEYGKPNKDRSFEGKARIVVTDQMKTSNLKDRFIRNATDDNTAIWCCNKIVTFWGNASNFKEFKGTFNDNEAGAIALFTTWWNKNIKPNIDKLRKNDPNKKTLTSLFSTIITKAEGSTSNDTARWSISTLSGSKSYSVDTDF